MLEPVSQSQIMVDNGIVVVSQQAELLSSPPPPPKRDDAVSTPFEEARDFAGSTLPELATPRRELASPGGDLLTSASPATLMTRDAVELLVTRAERRLANRFAALERRQYKMAVDSSQCLRLLKRIASSPDRRNSSRPNIEIDDVFETDA